MSELYYNVRYRIKQQYLVQNRAYCGFKLIAGEIKPVSDTVFVRPKGVSL